MVFAFPLVLFALAGLPALWWWLRLTPPRPQPIVFPPLAIAGDLHERQEQPARTPWWLLASRLLIAACLVLAAAGPLLHRPPVRHGEGPLLLMVDNGYGAAPDWGERSRIGVETIQQANDRPVALLAFAELASPLDPISPLAAIKRLRALQPRPHRPDRMAHLDALKAFLDRNPQADMIWIHDRIEGVEGHAFVSALEPLARAHRLTIMAAGQADLVALGKSDNRPGALSVPVMRVSESFTTETLRAHDAQGALIGEASFAFPSGERRVEALFSFPTELRNQIARVDIAGIASAGAVTLLDESGRRRRVGILDGGAADQAQPLLSAHYYLTRALSPFAEIRTAQGEDALQNLIDQQVSVLILADIGVLDERSLRGLDAFLAKGGVLLRFAGNHLAAGQDDLTPVRLRRGGRTLGGALSWDAPRDLAEFSRESPFQGLAVPPDLRVQRQILAEPDADLARRTWASLRDGTPIVTAEKRGDGLIVLFHVTADPSWSNLPLSGLYVDMLRRILAMAGASPGAAQAAAESLSPRAALDGFGRLGAPPATARPIPAGFSARADFDHPPGFYGPSGASIAVNALAEGETVQALDIGSLPANIVPLNRPESIDLRAPLLVAALILFMVDTLATLWLKGQNLRFAKGFALKAPLGLLFLAIVFPQPGHALDDPHGKALEAALSTRLAYVVTGDGATDAASLAGLQGLSQVLSNRTSLDPAEPAGIDPARDELSVYPLIYWPIAAARPLPSGLAIRRIDAFMKNGGTVIFDTRDAAYARPGTAPTPEGAYLRKMLASLDIPALEPLSRDHVLTKSFYLLDGFAGRFTGETWVEALPPVSTDGTRRPARAGDGVSPLVITGNDLAAAWASGMRGEARYPLSRQDPRQDSRQREMALRGGVNLVIYALTGNYKADQVHVPALLERLGQ